MKPTLITTSTKCLDHLTGTGHPESPMRLSAILQALKASYLLTSETSLEPREASRKELLLCHTADYIDIVKENIRQTSLYGMTEGSFTLSTGDVQISPGSWEAALLAVGSVLEGIDAIMTGKAKNVFSAVRPPGHHACSNQGMGFCIFNNVAIGARYVQQKYGLKKVLIADWDVHHGNGTQEIFDEDPTVFYFSTHQEGIYPGTGLASEIGKGAAAGTKLNFPIAPGTQSREKVLKAFQESLVRAMEIFRPEFVFISAGFDSHYADPLGAFNLTEQDFTELTYLLKEIADHYANGRLLSALEGGYNLGALAQCAVEHVKSLRS